MERSASHIHLLGKKEGLVPRGKPARGFHQTATTPSAARVPGRGSAPKAAHSEPCQAFRKTTLGITAKGCRQVPAGSLRTFPRRSGRPRAARAFVRNLGPRPAPERPPERATPRACGRRASSKSGLPALAHPAERAPRSQATAAPGCHVAPPHPSRWPLPPGTEMLRKDVPRRPPEPGRPPSPRFPGLSALPHIPPLT